MKKILIYFIALILISTGCQKDDNSNGSGEFRELPKEGVVVRTSVFGRIVDERDMPMSGVLVAGGGITAATDGNGVFILKDVMLDQARAYITAVKAGYFKGSRIFRPVKDGISQPTLIKMLAQKSLGTINASAGGFVQSAGGIKVELPANAIDGYTGQVNVVTAYLNPTSPDFFARMPGDLAADNSENKRGALISYGMAHIDLLDNSGNKLKIKTGSQAIITLPVPASLQASATPTIAMWHFDEVKGIWKEEGSGALQGGKYVGKVSHFSVWNFDHWNSTMILPIWLTWIAPIITSMPPDDAKNILDNPPRFIINLKDKKTGNTLYSDILPPVTTNDRGGTVTVTYPVPVVTSTMEVTVQPVQPGGPDYPTNNNYSPTADEVPPAGPTFTTEQERVTVDYPPTNPPTTIRINYPPAGLPGGNGETIVNVNGKAVNCENKAVTSGYAFLSMRSGNTIVRSTVAPVFGNEGRFTAQYIFYNALPNRIDNVVLTVYDVAAGKKSQDIKINVNPSVAYMIPNPVAVCDNNTGGGTGSGKVYTGNYSINSVQTLQAFIDSAYTEVNGILYVSNISDLGGIIKLKKVWGLELRRTNATSLGGLAELESLSWLSLVENGQLTNAAFPKLANKDIQGIHINHNLSLIALTLPSIENVSPLGNDNISITGNPILKTLSIPNLKSVDKCSFIEIVNTLLENLNTFTNASGTLGSWGLNLTDNPLLTSVSGMKNIICTGRLTIDQCIKLATLDGINIPVDMPSWVSITRNDALTDISAVGNKLKTTDGLTVNSNKILQTASFPAYEKGSISLKENSMLTSFSLPKFKEAASVGITNNVKLASINMNALETITNSFEIRGGYETTQALTAFDLPSLKTCGRLVIENCPAITNLDGFNNLESISLDLTISNANIPGANIKLKTINGFNKLTSVKYSLGLETAAGSGDQQVGYNGPLNSIKGFKTLKTVGAMFNIGGKNLTDISGFTNLESVGQDIRITTTGLSGLEGFAKLSSAGSVEDRLIYIQDNNNLTSLKGMVSLTNVAGIYIVRNSQLKDLQGLEKINSMKNGITVSVNNNLINIDGLANVAGATSGISITDNTGLRNLCGITKLVKGGGNTGVYRVTGNGYNPTQQNVIDGNCSN